MATIPSYMYKPIWIANTFLAKAREDNISDIDPLKIQKLVYNFHGWHLAVTGQPAVGERFEAWPKGPVLSSLYHKFKHYRWDPIRDYAKDIEPTTGESSALVVPTSDEQFHTIFNVVWDRYKDLSGSQLSALTHAPNTPWTVAREQGLQYIPDNLIRDHFVDLATRKA
jgi:uncharacterized phage-associated protein